jgi:hypothetical protein
MSLSILAFGSVCRADFDALSDRDVLIVSDNPQVAASTRKLYSSKGWSVACYSWKRLEALVHGGFLFAKHLRDESKPLQDCEGRLQDTLRAYKEPTTFSPRILEARRLFSHIQTYPRTSIGRAWVADCLAVTVRNFGIVTLAEREISEFSYSGIINQIGRVYGLNSDERSDLLSLRSFKHCYRQSTGEAPSPSEAFISRIRRIVNRKLKLDLHLDGITPNAVVQDVMKEWIDAGCAYERMRVFEKAAVARGVRGQHLYLGAPQLYAQSFKIGSAREMALSKLLC